MAIEGTLGMHTCADILPNEVSVSGVWIERLIIVAHKRRFTGDGPRSCGSDPTPFANFITGPNAICFLLSSGCRASRSKQPAREHVRV
jgi:hypothetical protein